MRQARRLGNRGLGIAETTANHLRFQADGGTGTAASLLRPVVAAALNVQRVPPHPVSYNLDAGSGGTIAPQVAAAMPIAQLLSKTHPISYNLDAGTGSAHIAAVMPVAPISYVRPLQTGGAVLPGVIRGGGVGTIGTPAGGNGNGGVTTPTFRFTGTGALVNARTGVPVASVVRGTTPPVIPFLQNATIAAAAAAAAAAPPAYIVPARTAPTPTPRIVPVGGDMPPPVRVTPVVAPPPAYVPPIFQGTPGTIPISYLRPTYTPTPAPTPTPRIVSVGGDMPPPVRVTPIASAGYSSSPGATPINENRITIGPIVSRRSDGTVLPVNSSNPLPPQNLPGFVPNTGTHVGTAWAGSVAPGHVLPGGAVGTRWGGSQPPRYVTPIVNPNTGQGGGFGTQGPSGVSAPSGGTPQAGTNGSAAGTNNPPAQQGAGTGTGTGTGTANGTAATGTAMSSSLPYIIGAGVLIALLMSSRKK